MIPSIVVEPAALHLSELDDVQRRLRTKDFIRFWVSHAILLYGDNALEASPLVNEIKTLPQPIRTLWQTGMKRAIHFRLMAPGPSGWGGNLMSPDTIRNPPLSTDVNLVAVSPSLFTQVTAEEGRHSYTWEGSNAEVCRFDSISHALLAERLRDHRSCLRDTGCPVESVWKEFFQPYIDHAGSLAVVDRYALGSLLERRDGKSGLFRLLRGIQAGRRKMAVRVYTSLPDDVDSSDAAGQVRSLLGQLGWTRGKFELFALADQDFSRLFHFRYLRFDLFCRLTFDSGLEVLQGDTLHRPADIAIEEVQKEILQLEQRCVDQCKGVPLLVYP